MFGFDSVMERSQAKLLNPLLLAFVGDAVYSLYIRERLAFKGEGKLSQLQSTVSKLVSASGQSVFLNDLLPLFTEEEEEIYRRGRNAKKATKSKNASAVDYNRSTGFEAVLGFLYVVGDKRRLDELLNMADESLFKIENKPAAFKPIR